MLYEVITNRTTACLAALTLLATPTALAETKSYAAQPFDEIEAGGAIDVIYERADRITSYNVCYTKLLRM